MLTKKINMMDNKSHLQLFEDEVQELKNTLLILQRKLEKQTDEIALWRSIIRIHDIDSSLHRNQSHTNQNINYKSSYSSNSSCPTAELRFGNSSIKLGGNGMVTIQCAKFNIKADNLTKIVSNKIMLN